MLWVFEERINVGEIDFDRSGLCFRGVPRPQRHNHFFRIRDLLTNTCDGTCFEFPFTSTPRTVASCPKLNFRESRPLDVLQFFISTTHSRVFSSRGHARKFPHSVTQQCRKRRGDVTRLQCRYNVSDTRRIKPVEERRRPRRQVGHYGTKKGQVLSIHRAAMKLDARASGAAECVGKLVTGDRVSRPEKPFSRLFSTRVTAFRKSGVEVLFSINQRFCLHWSPTAKEVRSQVTS